RWKNAPTEIQELLNSQTVKRNYICSVFDAMFGLWPAPGHCLFHAGFDRCIWDSLVSKHTKVFSRCSRVTEDPQIHPLSQYETPGHWAFAQDAVPRCIHSGLYFWEKVPTQPDVGS